MATNLWRGDAAAVAQVNTITPANVGIGNTFSVSINGKTIAYVALAATVADVCNGLQALLVANSLPEFTEVNWTTDGTKITATAKTPGTPFTQTSSAAGGTATLVTATSVASAGPKDWSTAANWSTGSVPSASDDVVFTNSAADCLYGLNQNAITLTSLTIDQSFSGKIGNPRSNPLGYLEYRPGYLRISATTITIGNGPGAGSGRIKLDTGSVQTTLNVVNSGSPAEANIKAILWKGTHASNVVNISKGSFAAAYLAGETATIATLRQGYLTNQAGDTDVYLGSGCTLTAIVKTGGSLQINSSFSTFVQGPGNAGETVLSAGTSGTIAITGGMLRYRTGGTCTSLFVSDAGAIDFGQDPRTKTVTNCTLNSGATLKDPGKVVTFTNPLTLNGSLGDFVLDLGSGFGLQRS